MNYINATTPIEIICPIHGSFWQTYANHTHKTHPQDCPACSHKVRKSKLSLNVNKLLEELNLEYTEEKTFDWLKNKNKMYLDFYIPEYNLAIEVQGAQHFIYIPNFHYTKDDLINLQNRDLLKYELCKKHNLNIIYFADFKDRMLIPDNYFTEVITDLNKLKYKILSFK